MKHKYLWILLIIALLCAPASAFAKSGFDDYGYNEKACLFVGTLANWDAFLYGQPPLPAVDPAATDVMFIERQWNKSFDKMMFQGGAPADGAYCATNAHMNLSGDQLGWIWHELFAFAFSSQPIDGALAIEGMPGFYFITDKVWLTDPDGNETILASMEASFDDKYKGKINTLKSLTKKNQKNMARNQSPRSMAMI